MRNSLNLCKNVNLFKEEQSYINKFILLRGDYPSALKLFEKGQTNLPQKKDHDEQCLCGIARCSLKTGDIRR